MTEVARLETVWTADTSPLKGGLASAESMIAGTGGRVSGIMDQVSSGIMQGLGIGVGLGVAGLAAKVISLGGDVVTMGRAFDASMKNIQAVTGATNAEIGVLGDQLNSIGANSLAGPQAIAEAYYDVAGSVTNAANRMPVLQASIAASEAGMADLQGTVKAVTGVMNSYNFAADKATYTSDVLTRTVGMGVGTMDQFAGAFAEVSGTAAALKIPLENVAASMAFLTTKGFTASKAATQLEASMTAIIKPNLQMKAGLQAIGVESGDAALKMYGLEGTISRLNGAFGGSTQKMAEALGSQEALKASLALTSDEYAAFFDTFTGGIEGSTAAAQEIQRQGKSWELLQNKISAAGIALRDEFLPALNTLADVGIGVLDVIGAAVGIDLDFENVGEDAASAVTTMIGPQPLSVDDVAVTVPTTMTYAIQSGDTLWDIAQENNTTVQALKELNNLDSNLIIAGQTLQIPIDAEMNISTTPVFAGEDMAPFLGQVRELGQASGENAPEVDKLAEALRGLDEALGTTSEFEGMPGFFEFMGGEGAENVKNVISEFGILVEALALKFEISWANIQKDVWEGISGIVEAWNELPFGEALEISPPDLTEFDTRIAEAEEKLLNLGGDEEATATLLVTPVLDAEATVESVSTLMPELGIVDVSFVATEESLVEMNRAFNQLEELSDVTLTINEVSYENFDQLAQAYQDGIITPTGEPITVFFSEGTTENITAVGSQIDSDILAKDDSPMYVQVNSNVSELSTLINDTVRDRIMKITLMLSAVQDFGQDLAGFAEGGTLPPGVSLVGEKGPELLFSPGGGEYVMPSGESAAWLRGGSRGGGSDALATSTTIILNNPTFNGVQDPEGLYDELMQVARRRA